MQSFFEILILIASIIVTISVMFQEGESGGMATVTGQEESLFGRNRSSSKDATLQRITVISAVIFMVSAVVLAAI